jgi:glycosyltransferase involved in cell wall biosynthesis
MSESLETHLKVCIVSPFAYGALTGGHRGHAGGVEQQTTMCARWLAARGHDVSLITWDEGGPDGEVIDGVRVLKMRRREAGARGLRFFQRWRSLNSALERANADVYYQNCGDYVTGQVAAWCVRNNRRFVYSVASDPDCDRHLPKLPLLRERMLYKYGLTRAHTIVTQTDRQRAMLNNNFALNALVLPMPCPPLRGSMSPLFARREPPSEPRVLWIGRISPEKRFDLLLDVAERMSVVQFDVAGKPDDDDAETRNLLRRAAGLRNVHLHGLVGRDRVPELYAAATAVSCTSDYEGFPNTFLEAWSFGTPVVSTQDPDGLLTSRGLGLHVRGRDAIVDGLRTLISSPELWRKCSAAGFDYVISRHQPDVALGQLESIFLDEKRQEVPAVEPSQTPASGPVEPFSICFIAHPAWGEMSGGKKGEIGGIQRQLSLMARWFAARGHTVTLLTWDEGQPDEVLIDGVRVIKMCRRDEGIPGVRFFHPRWSSLLRAMKKADAQVYYQNTAEYVTGQASLWCRRNGRAFVFSVANDWDCEPEVLRRLLFHERELYLYGLKHADLVVAQTRKQQSILANAHNVASTVVPMPSPPTNNGLEPTPPDRTAPRVVWVGRIAEAKRLEMLLDVAEKAPEITFEVAGIPDPPSDYADALIERGRSIANVRMLGRVERHRIPEIYRGAVCLCCTSFHEGFPNTFLEAWSQGVPLVTTFDPDGLVAERGLGGIAADADGVVAELRRLGRNEKEWHAASERARQYYLENHLPESVVPRFEALFRKLADQQATGVSYRDPLRSGTNP